MVRQETSECEDMSGRMAIVIRLKSVPRKQESMKELLEPENSTH